MTADHHLDEHVAIIGTSGSGKSTTARARAEACLREKRHTLITDHTGVWWGLRSSADGKGAGFDLPIFGGRHADIPIAPGDGAAIARIVADGASAIVDLSAMRSGKEQRTFMAAFAAGIRAKSPGHFQWFVDEADEDVPEKVRDELGFTLAEDMIWMAKRGRSDGFVMTFITQRTADIANAALSQCTTIYAHNLISPADTEAFRKYVRAHGTKRELEELMAGLPALQIGERYIYSPKNHLLERGSTPLPATFDSGATPAAGQARREPKMLAQLDVSRIRSALSPVEPEPGKLVTIEEATQTAYRAEISKRDERIAELEQMLGKEKAKGFLLVAGFDRAVGLFKDEIVKVLEDAETPVPAGNPPPAANPGSIRNAGGGYSPIEQIEPLPPAEPIWIGIDVGATDLPPAQQRILDQLAWACAAFRKPVIERQVLAIVLGVHPRTKGFLNNLGALRSAGFIVYPDGKGIALSMTGNRQAAKPSIAAAPLKDLRDQVCKWLPAAQARILRLAIDAFPNAIDRDRLAELLNTHPRTKSLLNNLGRLRTLGLLTGKPSHPRAAGYLFGKD